MQPNVVRSEAPQIALEDRLPRRRIRSADRDAGFFTLGIALAVLAAGGLFAGVMQGLDGAKTASIPAPTEMAGQRRAPAAEVKPDGAGAILISEAPSGSPDQAQVDAAPLR